MSLPPLEGVTENLGTWKSLSMSKDDAPTNIHRTILHAWRYVIRSHIAGNLTDDEYYYAYWMLVRAYNEIDSEYAIQEEWTF